MIVIDASSLAKYLLREENWREIEGYLLEPVYSIDHLVKEVTNAIWKHARTHRYISRNTALVIYNQLKRLVDEKIILIEPQEKYLDRAFIIALDNDIPIYDALYIAQALEYKKLLTSDNKKATIAKKLGIETILIS